MRAGELIDLMVLDSDGEKVGHIYDLHGSSSGSMAGSHPGEVRVDELDVGPRGGFLRLGYGRGRVKGPALFKWIAARASGYKLRWDQIEAVDSEQGHMKLNCSRSELTQL